MLRVAALTAGKNVPSARFRVRQYIAALSEHGIDVREYIPVMTKYSAPPGLPASLIGHPLSRPISALWYGAKMASRVPGILGSRAADLTWLERGLQYGRYTFESLLKRPYVFDADDAIWLARPGAASAVARMARDARVIMAGNAYLANWFSAHCSDVRIVPTALDTTRFHPRTAEDGIRTDRLTIGWTGISTNYMYLREIEPALAEFLRDHDAQLLIVSDAPPQLPSLPPDRIRFVPWSPTVEASAVREMDIGLMPLPCDDWTRGKCSFKMLQYMASGIPVVVSPVGMNAELLAQDAIGFGASDDVEWYDALQTLASDSHLREQQGAAGRALVEERYSLSIVSEQIAKILQEVA